MFADDIVVFSDDPHTLQNIFNSLHGHILQTTKSPNEPRPVKTKILIILLVFVTVFRKRGLLVGFAEFVFLLSLERASNAL